LFGVYGLSFLLILVNATLAEVLRTLPQRKFRALPWKWIVVAVILFAANLGYGMLRLQSDLDSREKSIKVALIQGNIDQGLKWNPGFQQETIDIYRDLTYQAHVEGKPELIIWPESATPFYFQDFSHLHSEVVRVPRSTGAFLLFGSPAYERNKDKIYYLNSAFLLDSKGDLLGRSDKVHLVPFGEYVPFGPLLPFIDKLVVGIGDFSPGTITPLSMNGSKAGVLVCFEGIFPELAREYVRKGSDLLINITNDAWFGHSSAPYQHLGMTRFRAVENRIWIARAANTGISALISPSGKIISQTRIFEPAALTGTVGLGSHMTLYTRIGDVLPVLCLAIGTFWFIRIGAEARLFGRKQRKTGN
jgi:apolipoprotein N-acyltransferase